jgi:23S rRNA (adenine-N6)-dimethyltransferase
LVRDASISADDRVLEIGAGDGRLTALLAERARDVIAVELDPELVERLRRRFGRVAHVHVLHADVRGIRLPPTPYRAFGNIPFDLTTPILRLLLDDPGRGPERADLVLQYEAARKRAAVHPGTLLTMGWLPWWELTLERRIPRRAFEPPPSVDAGVLVVLRRTAPLLPPKRRAAFVSLLRRAFDHGSAPVRRSLLDVLGPKGWKAIARERGLERDARPPELDVRDWIAVYEAGRG